MAAFGLCIFFCSPAIACKMTALGGSAAQLRSVLDQVAKSDKWREWNIVSVAFKADDIVATLRTFGSKSCSDVRYAVSFAGAGDCSLTVAEKSRKEINCQ